MPWSILNVGSLNIDYVYAVPHFVRPGETLTASSFKRYAGGKGLNQSIALARAGATVRHAGAIGRDGAFLADTLKAEGVDIGLLRTVEEPTGHAIIQTHSSGENCILLHGGANVSLTSDYLEQCLASLPSQSFVLTQNETNLTAQVLARARENGFQVVWNPAPITEVTPTIPLENIDYLILNEIEGAELTGSQERETILHALSERMNQGVVVLTLGSQGSLALAGGKTIRTAAAPVREVVDTTAAGDTFIGFLLASIAAGEPLAKAIETATLAAGLCVQRPGAAPSIPKTEELQRS